MEGLSQIEKMIQEQLNQLAYQEKAVENMRDDLGNAEEMAQRMRLHIQSMRDLQAALKVQQMQSSAPPLLQQQYYFPQQYEQPKSVESQLAEEKIARQGGQVFCPIDKKTPMIGNYADKKLYEKNNIRLHEEEMQRQRQEQLSRGSSNQVKKSPFKSTFIRKN